MSDGWRVMIDYGSNAFLRDEIRFFIALRKGAEVFLLKPTTIELDTQPIDTSVAMPDDTLPSIKIPRELAELLLESLANQLLGQGDVVHEIQRLRRALDRSEKRVDSLIAGIGRMGKEE